MTLLVKSENLIGPRKFHYFQNIFSHIGMNIPGDTLNNILEKNSFKNLSGREQGSENVNAHLRKGISGDWKNYFTDDHIDLFRKHLGELLIELEYEKDFDWGKQVNSDV